MLIGPITRKTVDGAIEGTRSQREVLDWPFPAEVCRALADVADNPDSREAIERARALGYAYVDTLRD